MSTIVDIGLEIEKKGPKIAAEEWLAKRGKAIFGQILFFIWQFLIISAIIDMVNITNSAAGGERRFCKGN